MTQSPRITFYDGILTIGGTKIAVQDGEYRIIFDFGLNYAPGGDFWGGKVQPRTGVGRFRDMLRLGYIPALDGLYNEAEASSVGLKPGGDGKTQVFISHLHLDHMGIADVIADGVPVWLHEESLRLWRAVAETGENPPVPVGARSFQWGQPIQVGTIKVTPVAVDHDIPGASALIIETSAGVVIYTGDLRMHGANPERVEAFVETARAANPKILLIEGTRLGEAERNPELPPALTEPEAGRAVAKLANDCKALALLTIYPRNTLRITNIVEALKGTGRTLVLSPETAHIWAAMGGDLSQVAIYKRYKDKQALEAGTAGSWLTKLFTSDLTVVDAAEVGANQQKYLLQLYFWDINELVDLNPAAGSVFIHSNGEPLGKFDPSFELFTRWLSHFGVELLFAPCTGHATSDALHEIVAKINPQLLMPIHSRNPELLDVASVRRTLPNKGDTYDIATGKLIK